MARPKKETRAAQRRRALWQDRLANAKAAYAAQLSEMDANDALYEGAKDCAAPGGGTAARKASNVRNIVYELVESQVDPTVPMPRVEAVHEGDEKLAKAVEALLRHKAQLLHFSEINDVQERTTPVQGASFWQVEWDARAGFHCTMGDVAVTDRHPRQIIPQPGVYELGEMDYVFVLVSKSKRELARRYGVDVGSLGEEEPGVRGTGAAPSDEMVTQNIAYYRNRRGGIGLFSWAENVTLEDDPDCQARSEEVCAECGAPAENGVCPKCGSRRTETRARRGGVLTHAVALWDGGAAMPGEFVPDYNPGRYPIVERRNVSRFGALLGTSDAAVVRDQQETIKKLGTKIDEKVLKGGSFVTLPDGVRIETTDRELKILRVKNPADKALIDVLNVQPDVSKDRAVLEENYQWAKSTLGITDAFQGKYDSSAISGTAKEFSANQAAGRLQSKREQKNAAYARLYEMMFRFLLAYADQPVPYAERAADGTLCYAHFNRWDFLRRDEAGELYWNDEFIFSVDPSATLSSNRSVLWEQMDAKYQSGAFGPVQDVQSRLLYWTLLERLDYPHAGEVKAAVEREAAQQTVMQGGEMNALPQV